MDKIHKTTDNTGEKWMNIIGVGWSENRETKVHTPLSASSCCHYHSPQDRRQRHDHLCTMAKLRFSCKRSSLVTRTVALPTTEDVRRIKRRRLWWLVHASLVPESMMVRLRCLRSWPIKLGSNMLLSIKSSNTNWRRRMYISVSWHVEQASVQMQGTQKNMRTVGSIQKPSLGAICMPAHDEQWHIAQWHNVRSWNVCTTCVCATRDHANYTSRDTRKKNFKHSLDI